MPLPSPSPVSTTAATPCQVNPQLWHRGTARAGSPPLQHIANAPLTAEGTLVLPALRQTCRSHGSTALIDTVLAEVHAHGPGTPSEQAMGLFALATFALPDASAPAALPHPGPLDLRSTRVTDVGAHARQVTNHERCRQEVLRAVLGNYELAYHIAANGTGYPGKTGFLQCSDRMIHMLHAPAPAGDTDTALRTVLDTWQHWEQDALQQAVETMWRGQEPDYLSLWLSYGLGAHTCYAATVRAALWQLAIEGFAPIAPASTAAGSSTAGFTGPLVNRLRQGLSAGAVIERFMVSEPRLIAWIHALAAVVATGDRPVTVPVPVSPPSTDGQASITPPGSADER